MNFPRALREEFNHPHYVSCIRDGRVEIYYTLRFTEPQPKILLIFDQSGNNRELCSLWEAELTDENVLQHMEEEVGIDTSGLESFAGYFCDAILSKPSMDRDEKYFPENPEATTCALKLSYNLGGTNLEGSFVFHLIQKDLNKQLLEMFRLLYETDKTNQITLAIRATKPKKQKLTRISVAADTSNKAEGSGEGADDEEETVLKAKKRKVGGVKIFPGKKK